MLDTQNIYFWTTLLKILGVLSFLMAMYGLTSKRVYGRSWKKYMGGWIYKKEDKNIYYSYIFMYFAITFFAFICSVLFGNI